MPDKANTFAVSPNDEPAINWQFDRDPQDPDARDTATVDLKVEGAEAEQTPKEKLETTGFEGVPNVALEVKGSLDELANLILSAIDFANAARDGLSKVLRDIEDALGPFVNEQKKKALC